METSKTSCPIFTLAKFSMATEPGKTRIAHDIFFPKYSPRSFHKKAKNSIQSSLIKGFNMEGIDRGIKYIKNKDYKDDWEKQNSILALENYKKVSFPFPTNSSFEKNNHKKEIEINGLCIYVNPEVIIKEVRNDKTYVGAIKFNISKTSQDKINYNFCRTIVFEYLKTIISEGEKVDYNMIYFYTPLNNNWNSSNTLLHLHIIENTIDNLYNYLDKPRVAV